MGAGYDVYIEQILLSSRWMSLDMNVFFRIFISGVISIEQTIENIVAYIYIDNKKRVIQRMHVKGYADVQWVHNWVWLIMQYAYAKIKRTFVVRA